MSSVPDQNTPPPIFTIGYGSRSVDDLIALLRQHQIEYLIDVRSQPYSRFKPEFSKDALEDRLKEHDIKYVFLGDKLGGRPTDDTCYTDGRVDYDKCMGTVVYQEGIARLRTAWDKQLRVVVMCSEGKPEDCHRSKLIGRTLQDQQITIAHIDETGTLLTQEEVIYRITHGQPTLFGLPDEVLISRKSYRKDPDKENGDADET